MDYLTLILFVAGGALALAQAVLGWFAKTLWNAVQELKTDLARLREELPTKYAQRDDFKDLAQELREMFREISNKLDKKVDK